MNANSVAYHNRHIAVATVLGLSLLAGVWAADKGADRPNALGFGGDRYEALHLGGQVYLVTVEKFEKNTKTSDAGITRGVLELRVEHTIVGHTQERTLRLPCAFITSVFSKAGWEVIWPKLPIAKEQILLVVVIPMGVDRLAGEQNTTTAAACEVDVVSGPNDPLVREFKRMAELHSIQQPSQILEASKEMLKSSSTDEQVFALRTLGDRAPAMEAISVLEGYVASPPRGGKPVVAVESLGTICRRSQLTDVERLAAQLALAREILKSGGTVKSAAVRGLYRCIADRPRPREFDELKAPLIRILTPLTTEKNGAGLAEPASRIIAWLALPATAPSKAAQTWLRSSPTTPMIASIPTSNLSSGNLSWQFDAYRSLRYRVNATVDGGEKLACLVRFTFGQASGTSARDCQITVETEEYNYSPPSGTPAIFRGVEKGVSFRIAGSPLDFSLIKQPEGLLLILRGFQLSPIPAEAEVGDKAESMKTTTLKGIRVEDTARKITISSRAKDAIVVSEMVRSSLADPSKELMHRTMETKRVDFIANAGLAKSVDLMVEMADQPLEKNPKEAENSREGPRTASQPRSIRIRIELDKAEPLAR